MLSIKNMGFLAVKDDSFLCVRFFLPFPSAMAKKQHEISEFNRGQVVGAVRTRHQADIHFSLYIIIQYSYSVCCEV